MGWGFVEKQLPRTNIPPHLEYSYILCMRSLFVSRLENVPNMLEWMMRMSSFDEVVSKLLNSF